MTLAEYVPAAAYGLRSENRYDGDFDGLPDGWEILYLGTTIGVVSSGDDDADGLNNGLELTTTFTDPGRADTDGDGLDDGTDYSTNNCPLDPGC